MSLLEPNEVACTVRLVCKAAAARYTGPQRTRIRLSQRVPGHAFARRWDLPEAMRSLCHKLRKQLLCLTAASGSIPNLQLLLPLVGCTLDSYVFAAAAAAGHLGMCQWLRAQGCPEDDMVKEAAGRSGSRALCDWLIAAGCPGGAASALKGAASAGHVGLVDQLLASYGPPEEPGEVLLAAAGGCDLPTLRRLHAALVPDAGKQHQLAAGFPLVVTAAGSATPDWREKMEWLAAQGCRRTAQASHVVAARCPDALGRLTWQAARGWRLDPWAVAGEAARRGNVEVLQLALEAGGRLVGPDNETTVRGIENKAIYAAAGHGQLAALQHLHGRGCDMKLACIDAALHGHLHVVAWLVETLGAGAVLSEEVFTATARSGSLPLLTWLCERGCMCRDASVLSSAVEGGASEEALEWLLAQGCSMQLDSRRWGAPARRGDLATLAWLRRMGCPWAEDGSTFTEAVRGVSPLPVLRWLAEAGCPVDWAAALEEARAHWRDREAVAGLEELRGQQAGQA